MEINKAGIALIGASIAGGASADSGVSYKDWAKDNPREASRILANNSAQPEALLAQSVIETGELTKTQVAEIQRELTGKNSFSYDVKGADDYLQADASYTYRNLGLGVQLIDTDNVNQFSITGGAGLTFGESHALSRVIENGQIKVSLVESEVKNALANFDETGVGVELIINLKNALFKQATLSHSNHSINITDGSDRFRVVGIDTQISVSNRSNGSQNIQTTTVDTTTNEVRNVSEDVTQTGIQVLLSLSEDLDVVLGYAKDSLGQSLSSAELEYQINRAWSVNAKREETRRFSGNEVQDVNTATLNYTKGKWSGFVGVRDNGFNTEPFAGIQYRTTFGDHSTSRKSIRRSSRVGSSLTSPVRTATEIHTNAISQETRSTTQTTVTEAVDNLATGGLSNVRTTADACSVDFNVSDADGVDRVIVALSNGTQQEFSTSNGTATFTGLAENTTFGIELIGITQDGINGGTTQQVLGTAQCRTLQAEIPQEPEEPETPEPLPENETTVSSISGATTISVGDSETYSITATDVDGINSVTATINGSPATVSQSGDQFSIELPSSVTASAGSFDVVFSVTGELANGGTDTPVVVAQNVEVEPVISSPVINSIGTVSINDNGGLLPTTVATVSGSDIQAGAIFAILTPVDGLSIDANTGEMTFDDNVNGVQSFTVTVQVTNTDGGTDTETFTLNIDDNA